MNEMDVTESRVSVRAQVGQSNWLSWARRAGFQRRHYRCRCGPVRRHRRLAALNQLYNLFRAVLLGCWVEGDGSRGKPSGIPSAAVSRSHLSCHSIWVGVAWCQHALRCILLMRHANLSRPHRPPLCRSPGQARAGGGSRPCLPRQPARAALRCTGRAAVGQGRRHPTAGPPAR